NRHLIESGVLTPWLAANSAARAVADANALGCAAGLGGLDAARARTAISVATDEARDRFAALGVTPPTVSI
ncbi:MAG: hypothetical protein ABIU95_13815, partial [Burkholderiales bacterium]